MSFYESVWWSVDLPRGWEIEQEEECTTFYKNEGVGALQISAYRNETREVTDEDLTEFGEFAKRGFETQRVRTKALTRLKTSNSTDNDYWEHWYLRAGRLLVYVTYNCASEHQGIEHLEVYETVESLRPTLYDATTHESS